VRAHINEVRGCYNQALLTDPEARGRVVLAFTIDDDGAVSAAVIDASEIENAALGQCITRAARKWKFPAVVDGGAVVVRYPFVLEAGSVVSPAPLGGRRE
jgi:TonB family protein